MNDTDNLQKPRLEGKKISFLVTQSKYGGAQKYILQLARYFAQKNEIVIFVGEKNERDPYFFSEAERLGLRVHVVENLVRDISLVKAFDALLEIRKLLVKERPDILHLNSSMGGAIGSCAAWLYGFDPLNKAIRVIYTAHGFIFNEPLPRMKKMIYLLIERISASWKAAIITVSEFDRNKGIEHKIAPAARMVMIHNGIETPDLLPFEDARAKLGIPERKKIIGTIASFYPTKGLPYLIDAMEILISKQHDAHLVIIGDGPDRKSLEEHIARLHLTKHITLCGLQSNASQYLNAFDIFVLPSVKEGLPFAILEAGAAGLPVVATKVGGIPEIIQDKITGILVDDKNPDQLATALLMLASDRDMRARLGKNLKQRVTDHFSESAMLQKTEDLYLRLYPDTTSPEKKQSVEPLS